MNNKAEFEKWYLSLGDDGDFTPAHLTQVNGSYFYTSTNEMYKQFCKIAAFESENARLREMERLYKEAFWQESRELPHPMIDEGADMEFLDSIANLGHLKPAVQPAAGGCPGVAVPEGWQRGDVDCVDEDVWVAGIDVPYVDAATGERKVWWSCIEVRGNSKAEALALRETVMTVAAAPKREGV